MVNRDESLELLATGLNEYDRRLFSSVLTEVCSGYVAWSNPFSHASEGEKRARDAFDLLSFLKRFLRMDNVFINLHFQIIKGFKFYLVAQVCNKLHLDMHSVHLPVEVKQVYFQDDLFTIIDSWSTADICNPIDRRVTKPLHAYCVDTVQRRLATVRRNIQRRKTDRTSTLVTMRDSPAD